MLRYFATRWLPFWLMYFLLGWWIGSKLVAIPSLQSFKVLNVIGLCADLAGLLILSRFVLHEPRLQRFVVGLLAENLHGLFLLGIGGLLLRSQLGASGPSSQQVEALALQLLFFFVVPLSAFAPAIVEKLIPQLQWSDERKASALGGSLLVFGICIQIWAAVLDLYS